MAIDLGYLILSRWRKYWKPIRPGTKNLPVHGDLTEFHRWAGHLKIGVIAGLVGIWPIHLAKYHSSPWSWAAVVVLSIAVLGYVGYIVYEELVVDGGAKKWKIDNTLDMIEKLGGVPLCVIGFI